ncbi:hypothetical protein [Microcoleus sp. bin38.metabat.b11b12b14.051]|uniref:hypothetical protein n=1 Tax=Microcoleus sp. bin38.metabat.b11b12b14.051 TaxID=2742709 RepID=UPI0025CF4E63|nr:hypothetical protein [Microcoleus sp. bin38.metabat.b11b12b14.051]
MSCNDTNSLPFCWRPDKSSDDRVSESDRATLARRRPIGRAEQGKQAAVNIFPIERRLENRDPQAN